MSRTLFVDWPYILDFFKDKRVAIVGSGPGCLDNDPALIDSYDVVVRVNNYKLSETTGKRTDVFYSFFGGSIRKSPEELQNDGVVLCMNKCPDAQFIDSSWHKQHNRMAGVNFRLIYNRRSGWWFTTTYSPTLERFVEYFNFLGKHIPSSGFQAILEISKTEAKEIYLTGFDFFTSKVHNVNEPWRLKNLDDPIRHVPDREFILFREMIKNDSRFKFDRRLSKLCQKKT